MSRDRVFIGMLTGGVLGMAASAAIALGLPDTAAGALAGRGWASALTLVAMMGGGAFGLWLQRRRSRAEPDPEPGPLGHAIMSTPPDGQPWPRTGYLRCAACEALLDRDPLTSDVAVLTFHWMSEHPDRWVQLHPEDAEHLR